MAKIEITKTELVWPGKYNEDGTLKEVPRVSLPFQVVETDTKIRVHVDDTDCPISPRMEAVRLGSSETRS